MALSAYPVELVSEHVLADGTRLTIRPIEPDDADREREFVDGLSDRSRYLRFMSAMKHISPQMVSRFTHVDYDHEMALIVLAPSDAGDKQVAVARYAAYPNGKSCEFAIVVADEWHNKGLATELLRRLIDIARGHGLERMDGIVLRENRRMLSLARDLGFEVHSVPGDAALMAVSLRLRPGATPAT